MKCERKGCQNIATCKPQLRIPPKGWPKNSNCYLPLDISNLLCDEHYKELEPDQFLTEEVKNAVRQVVAGHQPPDFKRAYYAKISLGSPGGKIN